MPKAQTPAAPIAPAEKPTKQSQLLVLVRRPHGATLENIIDATGWLPHTVRAAIQNERIDGVNRYRLVTGAGA